MKELYSYFKKEIDLVNSELLRDLPSDIALLQDVFHYIFNCGGKRLRPLLTIAFSKFSLVSNKEEDNVPEAAICLAAAVELIHTATLLHDDVIDNGKTRRNMPTANSVWDNKTSILVGDNMFSKAFQLIVKSGKLAAFEELANASATISSAEVFQIQLLNKVDVTIDDYIRLITDKTAVLFAAASAVGAIASDFTSDDINAAREFGINYGILYQIQDDMLDYFGNEDEIGKETFQDIREGKVTLPLILLLSAADEGEKSQIENIVGREIVDRDLLDNLMRKYEIESKVIKFSEKYRRNIEAILPSHISRFFGGICILSNN
jgi:octaprenyl-diphosphate synthase